MPHEPLPPFVASTGNADSRPKIVIVGEAWGENEALMRQPFVGESGKEFFRMLGEAAPDIEPELHNEIVESFKFGLAWANKRKPWLEAAGIVLTNVLALRPANNKIENLCGTKAEMPLGYKMSYIRTGKYLRPEYLPELDRLQVELETWSPNLIVLAGNTAIWAVLKQTKIGSIRGAITGAQIAGKLAKCLPIYHPAGIMRQWAWRPTTVADLMKGFREAKFPEIRRLARQILVSPTLDEIEAWVTETLARPPKVLGCDTETRGGQIKMISFARSKADALVVPFIDETKPNWSYWPEPQLEIRAWELVEQLLLGPIPKVWQNGMYDFQYVLISPSRLGPRPDDEDTMLLHHSLFPEVLKGLGFLGSIYADEPAWKDMRSEKADTEKRDE